MQPYTLYYMDVSYYSGKLQSYLRYKEIPHRAQHINWWMMTHKLLPNTGIMEVPVLESPEGEWLRDSTAIIRHLESRFPEGGVIPADPYQAFFNLLLEDYADEWLWRPAMHYRWSYAKDRRLYERRFIEDFMLHPLGTRWLTQRYLGWRQKRSYVTADGVNGHTRSHVEYTYLGTLQRLEAILQRRDFLFGDKPSVADFGFMASMFRHFSLDPTPGRIMREQAPGVYAWVARMWNARHSKLGESDWAAPAGQLPADWAPLLEHLGQSYAPYLAANAAAFQAGHSHFDLKIEGTQYQRLPVIPYRAWCLEKLFDHYRILPEASRHQVRQTLEQHGILAHLWPHKDLISNLPDGHQLPHCTPIELGFWQRMKYYFIGTPRHQRAVQATLQ